MCRVNLLKALQKQIVGILTTNDRYFIGGDIVLYSDLTKVKSIDILVATKTVNFLKSRRKFLSFAFERRSNDEFFFIYDEKEFKINFKIYPRNTDLSKNFIDWLLVKLYPGLTEAKVKIKGVDLIIKRTGERNFTYSFLDQPVIIGFSSLKLFQNTEIKDFYLKYLEFYKDLKEVVG